MVPRHGPRPGIPHALLVCARTIDAPPNGDARIMAFMQETGITGRIRHRFEEFDWKLKAVWCRMASMGRYGSRRWYPGDVPEGSTIEIAAKGKTVGRTFDRKQMRLPSQSGRRLLSSIMPCRGNIRSPSGLRQAAPHPPIHGSCDRGCSAAGRRRPPFGTARAKNRIVLVYRHLIWRFGELANRIHGGGGRMGADCRCVVERGATRMGCVLSDESPLFVYTTK